MTYFTMAGAEEKALLSSIIHKWHRWMEDQNVAIGFLFAKRDDDKPAVKHGGYPALATVSIVPLKDRLTKKFDAELLVEEKQYRLLSPKGKVALLDHEMSHLLSQMKYDDLGRPMLKLRKGDWHAGDGFREVCARHGEYAIEFENLRLAFGRAQSAVEEGKING